MDVELGRDRARPRPGGRARRAASRSAARARRASRPSSGASRRAGELARARAASPWATSAREVVVGEREARRGDDPGGDQREQRSRARSALAARREQRRRSARARPRVRPARALERARRPGASGSASSASPPSAPPASATSVLGRQPRAQPAAVAAPGERGDAARRLPAGLGRGGARPPPRRARGRAAARASRRRQALASRPRRPTAPRRSPRPRAPRARRCRRTPPRRAAPACAGRPGLDRDRRDPPPGDPGAEPVGGEQGVERAPLAVLAAAERRGRRASLALRSRLRVGDQVDELAQRLLDPAADPGAEPAAQRAAVGGHALADRLDDLVAERRRRAGGCSSPIRGGSARQGSSMAEFLVC